MLPIILAGLAIIIKDQRRKRVGEPRPYEVAQAQRQERKEAERLLVEKYNPSPYIELQIDKLETEQFEATEG